MPMRRADFKGFFHPDSPRPDCRYPWSQRFRKSTFLKLLMRFWDVQGGTVCISGRDVRKINTANLREMESYVTQETCLFHDSIANNIAVGRPGASREEIMEAAKKASGPMHLS